jgi:hypothetical protein
MRVLHTHAIFWVSRIVLRYHPILPSLFVLLPYQMIAWFIDSGNKTGCRFVVVDAYNEERPIRYYQKCGFDSFKMLIDQLSKRVFDFIPAAFT